MALPQVLQDMTESRRTMGRDGAAYDVESQIEPNLVEALHRVVLVHKPDVAIEVGLAYGFSALAMLGAMEETGVGRLVSIDPLQSGERWRGAGSLAIELSGLADRHALVEEPSYLALPELLRAGTRCQFGYIDGWHTFDYALLDFFYLDKMLDVGGVIGFNDCHFDSVHKVLRFIQTHRLYREIDTGLQHPPVPRDLRHRARGERTGQVYGDRYFEKVEDREPDWNYYRRF